MKITKSRLKQIIKEQIEATLVEEEESPTGTAIQAEVERIFDLITTEIKKTPELQRGVIWSWLMSEIAKKANESKGSELQDVAEVLDPDADVGDYIKDFKKSDAPQFKGKSEKKRKQMAIAAALSEEET